MAVTYKEQTKTPLKIVALIVGLLIFALSLTGGIITMFVVNRNQRLELENVYQRSFYELTDASNNLELSLSKMLAAGSDEQASVLAMEVYKNAETAMDALTRLPLEHMDVVAAEKFYNQVGDFSFSLNKNMAYKRDSASYRDRVEDLYIAAREVNRMIFEEGELLRSNNYNFTTMNARRAKENREKEAADGTGGESVNYASIEYPELIYDGPFSDSSSKKCYKALENLPEITFEQAAGEVFNKLPFSVSGVNSLGETLGSAPAYIINAVTDAGEIICSVSKKGGMFLSVSFYIPGGNVNISEDDAKTKATGYAQSFGYDVQPVWYNEGEGIATINLAPVKDGVVYYCDLVKIKVSLTDGAFCGLEAAGYCMNNCERTFSPAITETGAREKVSKRLQINNVRLAVVPDGQDSEALAYEIAAEYKGLDYFIYIGADDGREINIMRVIDGEQGKLTM